MTHAAPTTPTPRAETGDQDRAPLRVVILMVTASPWSQLVATSLAKRGVVVSVLDPSPYAPDFVDADEAQRTAAVLAESVASVRRVRVPRFPPARLAASVA